VAGQLRGLNALPEETLATSEVRAEWKLLQAGGASSLRILEADIRAATALSRRKVA